jgi:hypothetical protein
VNDQVDLKIFHYHFLTGGVSTVVRQAVEAFHDHLPAIRSAELIAGAIPGEFRSQMRRNGAKCMEMPEIGYLQPTEEPSDHNRKIVARRADKLAGALLGSFGSDDSVWWVHNYHLGKNVVFTQALLEIIHSGRPQRIILQIHDFPECGRFANLERLKAALSLDPYPVSPWVRYAVLNRRDQEILIKSGIPAQDVFLLENPVLRHPDSEPEPGSGKAIRSRLKRLFGKAFPRFDPRAPLLLYPIRTIRRKNALEAMLICHLLDRGANILITLPGVSVSERPYSDLVEHLFADRLCPGLWGIGSQLKGQGLGFDDLVAASDLVLSTSVQEGFGYLFINSLLWSLPLAARDLDTLTGLKEDLFGEYPAYFYDTIRVPVPDAPSVAEAYRSKIKGLSELIPPAEQERLLAEVEQLVRDDRADFSYLPVEAQEKLLREISAGDGPDLRICRTDNRITLSRIEQMLASQLESATDAWTSKPAEVDRRFGPAAYSAGFRRIVESFGTRRDKDDADLKPAAGGIGEQVQKAFLNLENLRLLYDY